MIVRLVRGAAVALALLTSAAASARIVTVNASGTVANSFTFGGASTSVPVGSPLTLSFSFDTDALELIGANATSAGYRFTAQGLTARIGDYQFVPLTSFGVVSFAQGFGFFGGPSSEAVLNQTFAFSGAGEGAPFSLPGGIARTSLGFTSTFRYGAIVPPIDPSALTDPALAARGNFSFLGVPVGTGVRAAADGPAVGSFAGSVPEPTTWGMLLFGFGGLGWMLRRRVTAAIVQLA